jgi:hypothetical protein
MPQHLCGGTMENHIYHKLEQSEPTSANDPTAISGIWRLETRLSCHNMHNLWFSQHCSWRLKSYGIWWHVD